MVNGLHKFQVVIMYVWRKQYKLIDLKNRNPLLYDFSLAFINTKEHYDLFKSFFFKYCDYS